MEGKILDETDKRDETHQDGEVKMIGNKAIGVNIMPVPLNSLLEEQNEAISIIAIGKDGVVTISSEEDMVNAPR